MGLFDWSITQKKTPHIIWTRQKLRRLLVKALFLWSRYSEVTSIYLWTKDMTNLRVSRVVLLGTTVWGTYGNIISAPLVGFRNRCCGQKEYQCGGGYLNFCNTHMFWIFGKENRMKEPSVLGIWKKNQNQKKHQFWVFQKLQRTAGFHERTGKDPAVLGGCLIYLKKLRTLVIYNNQVF
jgi:hypothetical protein